MREEYVIVQIGRPSRLRRGVPTLNPSDDQSRGKRLEVIVTNRQKFGQARTRPDVEATARSISMKLIAPVAIRGIATESLSAARRPNLTWGVHAVGADTSPFDGADIVVAVLDTGIDRQHPAFKDIELIEEDFTGEGNGDKNGHGTHCAGTIFGRDVDGLRIGIARGVTKALIGKVIGSNGGSSAQIASAIQWALEKGANVISMSLGIDFPGYQVELQQGGMRPEPATSIALEAYRSNLAVFDTVSRLVNTLEQFYQPCLLIAAAGNESGREEFPPFEIAASPPAVSQGFISVAALREDGQQLSVAPFSNTGAKISAPGVGIISAKAGAKLIAMDGTSMATPHVAGVAALWAEKLKQEQRFTTAQFTTDLLASATRLALAPDSTLDQVGAGLVGAPQS